VGLIAHLDAVEKRGISCSSRELNSDPSVVQLVARSLYRSILTLNSFVDNAMSEHRCLIASLYLKGVRSYKIQIVAVPFYMTVNPVSERAVPSSSMLSLNVACFKFDKMYVHFRI
jgi:hypothetical protein